MDNSSTVNAKEALDAIIRKSRVHLYKPIQIAEILYHSRTNPGSINMLELEEYRNKSKKWRDEISIVLLGRICTSSARFQDDLFNDNAIPPSILYELDLENIRTDGAVESYIYRSFTNRHTQLSTALNYCLNETKESFQVNVFLSSFWNESGLKRSIDKIYEIIVYSLFSTLTKVLELKVEVFIDSERQELLEDFSDFAKMVMCLDLSNPIQTQDARVFRVGVTNAADRGLDMYANWGPAIQIKHLSLDEEMAESIVNNVSSDRIVIVCKNAEEKVIVSLLTQLGWRSKIQSIITELNLIAWYEKALRGKYSDIIGDDLLSVLCDEIVNEFPSLDKMPYVLEKRGYDQITDKFWI